MLHLTTSLAGRTLAWTSSLLFHAGVALALGGHAPEAPRLQPDAPIELEVSVLSDADAPVALARVRTDPPAVRSAPPRTHHHAYPVAHHHDSAPHDPTLVHAPVLQEAPPAFALVAPAVAARTPPSFALDLASARARTASPGAAAETQATAGAGGEDGPAVAEASVDTPARLLFGPAPPYPRAAAEASIEADVTLEVVVDVRGHVVSARAREPAGHGLAEAAVRAVRGYHFKPAQLRGRPTPVRMTWVMQFRLQ